MKNTKLFLSIALGLTALNVNASQVLPMQRQVSEEIQNLYIPHVFRNETKTVDPVTLHATLYHFHMYALMEAKKRLTKKELSQLLQQKSNAPSYLKSKASLTDAELECWDYVRSEILKLRQRLQSHQS
ncbi:MAG TPA: hypothetical protein VLG50_00540 [Candidatus Saccharimonadales bacterium]|nr:hypothetical protein [Candidatus Saccharimonadales bacterium]